MHMLYVYACPLLLVQTKTQDDPTVALSVTVITDIRSVTDPPKKVGK